MEKYLSVFPPEILLMVLKCMKPPVIWVVWYGQYIKLFQTKQNAINEMNKLNRYRPMFQIQSYQVNDWWKDISKKYWKKKL